VFQKLSLVAERQAPLRRTYVEDPAEAHTVKWAATSNGDGADLFHSVVHIGEGYGVSQRLGIDHAVGGDHDLPSPGDLLCAALATCEDATVRMIADILAVTILDLRVEVAGDVDVRGCLSTDRSVKVGFCSMECPRPPAACHRSSSHSASRYCRSKPSAPASTLTRCGRDSR
jgi:hypothetical protein